MRHALLVMGHGNLNIMKKYMEILDDERFEEGQTQRMRDAEPEHEQHTTGKDR